MERPVGTVAPLIDGIWFGALLADSAFDPNVMLADLDERGAKAVIAGHPRCTSPREIDKEMYQWRHLIGNFYRK